MTRRTAVKGFDDSFDSAVKHACKLLSYRDRSGKEMREKLLTKGFSGAVVDRAVAFLEEKGFINDEKLAEALRRDAVERRCLGRQGVRTHLVKRGIPRERAEALSTGGAEEDYIDAARRLIEKQLRRLKQYDEATVKRRLWGMLARRGFSIDSIRKAMKSLNMEEES